ncbi:MAG: hypothetical protein JW959_07155 [Pirellulales bacterium]|nr:hypothetical protein [Pirellulales bacterium]
MATILLPPDFKEFLKLLNSQRVEYLLVGGYAVGFYGYPRATGDMDVWVASTEKNAALLTEALVEFGFSAESIKAELFLQKNKVVRMGVPPLRIDLLTAVSGVDFDRCYEERTVDVIDDVRVNLISLDRLKDNKRALGRPKDIDDLEHLP